MKKWMTLLRDYMINHHINHTFWGLNPNSGDTGGLLSYDFMTWDTEKYDMFKESLWQTQKTGKFIGLDHQKALGTDGSGISVSEFYKSYASTRQQLGWRNDCRRQHYQTDYRTNKAIYDHNDNHYYNGCNYNGSTDYGSDWRH